MINISILNQHLIVFIKKILDKIKFNKSLSFLSEVLYFNTLYQLSSIREYGF